MKLVLLASGLVALATANQALVFPNHTDPPIECGPGLSCSADTVCSPDDPSTPLGRGVCVFKNTYSRCGGHTVQPVTCGATANCIDDPRNPNSCGMACDAPGICVPKLQTRCRVGQTGQCPRGLWCYRDAAFPCRAGKQGCAGICL
jgi:hypothetical protein